MCGLFGYMSRTTHDSATRLQVRTFMRYAMISSISRGEDGSGVAFSTAMSPDIQVYKSSAPGHEYADVVDKHLDKSKGVIDSALGHVRAATVGAVNSDGAHPFVSGQTVLTHNGTLDDWQIWKDIKYDGISVDSEALCRLIDRVGVEAALRDTVYGAYALAGILADGTRFLVRNEARPLAVSVSKSGKSIAYASSAEHLDWLLSISGKNFGQWSSAEKLKPGVMITMAPDGTVDQSTIELLDKDGYSSYVVGGWQKRWTSMYDVYTGGYSKPAKPKVIAPATEIPEYGAEIGCTLDVNRSTKSLYSEQGVVKLRPLAAYGIINGVDQYGCIDFYPMDGSPLQQWCEEKLEEAGEILLSGYPNLSEILITDVTNYSGYLCAWAADSVLDLIDITEDPSLWKDLGAFVDDYNLKELQHFLDTTVRN